MSMRIRKMIGYGIKHTKIKPIATILKIGELDNIYEIDIETYRQHLKDLQEEYPNIHLTADPSKTKPIELERSVELVYKKPCGEGELKGIVIAHPGYKDWKRFDNDIDAVESTINGTNYKNIIKPIPSETLYPFYQYVNLKNKQKINAYLASDIVRYKHNPKSSSYISNEELESLGFTSLGDAVQHVKGLPSLEIMALARALNIFCNPDDILTLSPHYAVTWG